MKKIMISRSQLYLLLICVVLALGLASCGEEEVIPMTNEDLEIEIPNNGVENAEGVDVIINDQGEVIGYFNEKLEMLDINRNLVIGNSNARSDRSTPQRVVLYPENFFRGSRKGYHSTSSNFYLNLRGTSWDLIAKSMVLPPNHGVRLYRDNNGSDQLIKDIAPKDGEPRFIAKLKNNGVNSDLSALEVYYQGATPDKNYFCGYAWKKKDYRGSGALPIYLHHDLDLTDSKFPTHNDNFESISTNNRSDCDGIMLYDKKNLLTETHHWVNPDQDLGNLGNVGLLNKVSRITHSPEKRHLGVKGNDDFEVGVILYEGLNYTGIAHYLPKSISYINPGGDPYTIRSLVVLPGAKLTTLVNSSGNGIRNINESFYNNINIQPATVIIQQTSTANTLCGVARSANGDQFPIFSSLSGDYYFDLDNYSWNNKITSFEPSAIATSCSGASFWANTYALKDLSFRRWESSTSNTTANFGSNLSANISSISTQGCTETAIGIDDEAFKTAIDLLNDYGAVISSNNRTSASATNSRFGVFRYVPSLILGSSALATLVTDLVASPEASLWTGVSLTSACVVSLGASVATMNPATKDKMRAKLPAYMQPSFSFLPGRKALEAQLNFALGGSWADPNTNQVYNLQSYAAATSGVSEQDLESLRLAVAREAFNKIAYYITGLGTGGGNVYNYFTKYQSSDSGADNVMADITNSTLRGGNP